MYCVFLIMKLSTFQFPIIMFWIPYLSGENFRFLLFIVIFVICVCILIVSCSVFLNWVYWARGNFSGGSGHVHIRMCESPLCGVPGRYEYIWSLCRCGWRYGTDFLFSLALFWRVLHDWNGGGGRDSTGFLVSLVLSGGYGTIEMAGLCCNFLFIFFSFMSLLLASGYAW